METTSVRHTELSDDQLHRMAPSIFAPHPWQGVSEKYRFVPTSAIVQRMRSEGFFPVMARQSKSRIEGKGDFTKHMLRFRQAGSPLAVVGQTFPEIVITNSHDRSAAYHVYAGLFRLLCSNGMVAAAGDLDGQHVVHMGDGTAEKVIDATFDIVENFPALTGKVETWQGTNLEEPHRLALAEAAITLKYDAAPPVQPSDLLEAHRVQDQGRDLWTTYNVIQENLIRGGQRYRRVDANGYRRRQTTRPVKSVDGDIRLNRALWILADRLQQSI